jgi:hypothetical protein
LPAYKDEIQALLRFTIRTFLIIFETFLIATGREIKIHLLILGKIHFVKPPPTSIESKYDRTAVERAAQRTAPLASQLMRHVQRWYPNSEKLAQNSFTQNWLHAVLRGAPAN